MCIELIIRPYRRNVTAKKRWGWNPIIIEFRGGRRRIGQAGARSSGTTRNRIMIRSRYTCRQSISAVSLGLVCYLGSLKRRQVNSAAWIRRRASTDTTWGFENETALWRERRTREGQEGGRTLRSDVAQGCPEEEEEGGREEEEDTGGERARPGTGRGGAHTEPHPSRVGRRMWQSLSLITHTHTRADAVYVQATRMPDDARHTYSPPMPGIRLTRRIMFCASALPQGEQSRAHIQETQEFPRADKRTTRI